jgi:hypothetical protein
MGLNMFWSYWHGVVWMAFTLALSFTRYNNGLKSVLVGGYRVGIST